MFYEFLRTIKSLFLINCIYAMMRCRGSWMARNGSRKENEHCFWQNITENWKILPFKECRDASCRLCDVSMLPKTEGGGHILGLFFSDQVAHLSFFLPMGNTLLHSSSTLLTECVYSESSAMNRSYILYVVSCYRSISLFELQEE